MTEAFASVPIRTRLSGLCRQSFESGGHPTQRSTTCCGCRRRHRDKAVFRVAPESGFAVRFSLLLEAEERLPRFAVLALNLLNRGRTENTAVATAILADVPYVSIWVSIVLAALIVDFVPEARQKRPTPSKQLLVLWGLRNHVERVGVASSTTYYIVTHIIIPFMDHMVANSHRGLTTTNSRRRYSVRTAPSIDVEGLTLGLEESQRDTPEFTSNVVCAEL